METCSLCTKPTPPEALTRLDPGIPICDRCIAELDALSDDRRDAWAAAIEAEAGIDLLSEVA